MLKAIFEIKKPYFIIVYGILIEVKIKEKLV
ncbi:hypothetical protein CLV86_2093 [Lacinutrix venerupis]|nr:hypothetical protein CLV86_2093 [Lacinutrix venerupis]